MLRVIGCKQSWNQLLIDFSKLPDSKFFSDLTTIWKKLPLILAVLEFSFWFCSSFPAPLNDGIPFGKWHWSDFEAICDVEWWTEKQKNSIRFECQTWGKEWLITFDFGRLGVFLFVWLVFLTLSFTTFSFAWSQKHWRQWLEFIQFLSWTFHYGCSLLLTVTIFVSERPCTMKCWKWLANLY